jgi:hypothetical protein
MSAPDAQGGSEASWSFSGFLSRSRGLYREPGALLGADIADVAADSFCPFVLEIFYLGTTTGTTPAPYDPAASVCETGWRRSCRTVDGV